MQVDGTRALHSARHVLQADRTSTLQCK